MFPEMHDLTKEFPALKDRILNLDTLNPEFHHTYQNYQSVDKEIIHFETKACCTDEHLDYLKKQRLLLKDKIYHMLIH